MRMATYYGTRLTRIVSNRIEIELGVQNIDLHKMLKHPKVLQSRIFSYFGRMASRIVRQSKCES